MSIDSNKLLKNTIIYTIGNFGAKILVFLLLPFYSFYLSKSELGTYDVVLTFVNFFVPIVSLQLADAVYRWLLTSNNDHQYQKVIISSGFILTIFSLTVFEIVYYIFNLYSSNDYYFYIIFLVVTSSLVPLCQNILRGLQKTKLYASGSLFQAVLLLVINIFCLTILDLRLEAVFFANIFANILTILYLFIGGRLYLFIDLFKINLPEIKELLKFSLPLIPNSISWWLVNAASKLIILYFLSTEYNGIYAVSSRFPTIITLFNSIFILAWQDHTIMVDDSSIDKKSFNSKVFDNYINFEMSITLILISSSELFIRYLVSSEFYDAYKYMPFLYLGAAFSAFSGYFGAVYLREKKTKGILTSSLLSGILNIIICFSLINKIGLYAPALGVFASFLCMFVVRLFQTKNFFYIKINYVKLIFLTILCLLFSFCVIWKSSLIISIILLLLSLIISYILNRDLIKKMGTVIINKIF